MTFKKEETTIETKTEWIMQLKIWKENEIWKQNKNIDGKKTEGIKPQQIRKKRIQKQSRMKFRIKNWFKKWQKCKDMVELEYSN